MPYSPRVMRLARLSIVVALTVFALKLIAWRLTGSVALLSDALESVVNVATAAAALLALGISRRPPDAGHPFGHHKAEYFAAVAEGVLIVLAALLILREAVPALLSPQPIAAPWPGIALNAAAAAVNALWAGMLIRTGQAERSPALTADGQHLLSDVVTSGGVLAGLGLAQATGWAVLDPALAIVVALNILREGWRVLHGSVGGLMDTSVSDDEVETIRATIRDSAAGAIEVHDIRTRHAGPATFIEFHLVVDGAMRVAEAHAICDRVERALARALPGARVTIHVEPAEKAKDALRIDEARDDAAPEAGGKRPGSGAGR